MKLLKLVLSICCIAFFSFVVNAQDFEGIIKITNSAPGGLDATFTLKGNLVLMEQVYENKIMKVLYDKATSDMTNIVDDGEKKMAIKMNLNSNPAMAQMKKNFEDRNKGKMEDLKITITTDTKTIGDYECVKVLGEDEDTEAVAWIAKDLKLDFTDLMPQTKQVIGARHPVQEKIGMEGFIMDLDVKNKKTKEQYQMKAEVEEKTILDNAFDIPEEYTYFDMTNIRQMMMDAQKDPEKMKELQEMLKEMKN